MPLTGKTFPGYKRNGLDPAICFYKVEDGDNSDSGYSAVIHVKIDKASTDTKKNNNNTTFSVIKSFGNQGPKFFCVLREMAVIIFEHLDITTWKGIDQRWMFIEQVLQGTALTKLSNAVIICK